jgi:ribosome-associated protein
MLTLQTLGEQLVGLTPDQIDGLEISEELREAVLFTKKIKKGEALRRQIQYIGVLMRDVDPERIRSALDAIARGRDQDARLFQELEHWRDGLVEGKEGLLAEVLHRFPGADGKWMNQLVLNARRERDANKPPKSARTLFRYLRKLASSETS